MSRDARRNRRIERMKKRDGFRGSKVGHRSKDYCPSCTRPKFAEPREVCATPGWHERGH